MNYKKLLTMAVLATIVVPLGVSTGSVEQSAQARSRYTLKTFPKRIRGTWYFKNRGHYERIRITSKSLTDFGYTSYLKQRRLGVSSSGRHLSWLVATNFNYKHQNWVHVLGYSQGAGDGAYYGKTTHRLGGHNRSMLHLAGGAMIWTDGYAFRSKHLAKLYSHKHFSGDRYRSSSY